jgi:exodeoxyribonuclease-3
VLKIATWNVNGIRARQAQIHELIDKQQPDVLCLQEIKASIDQLPLWLCDLEGYWCYWHGGKGYSGVALHVRKAAFPERPDFDHPAFDYEHRIVTAQLRGLTVGSIYVPNGGKDFPAKMQFLESLDLFAAQHEATSRPLVLCGDFNVARTDMDVHPKERKPNIIGQRHRAHHRAWARRRASARGAEQRGPVHMVGTVAEHATTEYRLAPRPGARQRGHRRHHDIVRRAA